MVSISLKYCKFILFNKATVGDVKGLNTAYKRNRYLYEVLFINTT
jgi:hypothetical protein